MARNSTTSTLDLGQTTLLLLDDAECELCVSVKSLTFAHWGQQQQGFGLATLSFAVSVIAREGQHAAGTNVARTPIVISSPSTSRFNLQGPTVASPPLHLLLHVGSPIHCRISFSPPSPTDVDFARDNFQDRITINSRLGGLVVPLFALRHANTREECNADQFYPRALPEVKLPSFKLFEQIEQQTVRLQTQVESNRPMLQESKPTPRARLLPPPSRTPTPPPPSAKPRLNSGDKRTASPRTLEPLPPSAPTDVNTPAEAREVILRLRARRVRVQPSTPTVNAESPRGPESGIDATTRTELAAFHAIVQTAKATVEHAQCQAKRELAYYQQVQVPSGAAADREVPPVLGSSDNQRLSPARTTRALGRKPLLLKPLRPQPGRSSGSIEVAVVQPQPLQSHSRSVGDDFDDADPEIDDAPVGVDDLDLRRTRGGQADREAEELMLRC